MPGFSHAVKRSSCAVWRLLLCRAAPIYTATAPARPVPSPRPYGCNTPRDHTPDISCAAAKPPYRPQERMNDKPYHRYAHTIKRRQNAQKRQETASGTVRQYRRGMTERSTDEPLKM